MARANVADLPEVTDEHRRAAFVSLCLTGTTYEAAMQDDTRRRIVEARAHQLRTRQWKAEKHQAIQQYVSGLRIAQRNARYTPHVGAPSKPWPPTVHDLKRAAAGDRDD